MEIEKNYNKKSRAIIISICALLVICVGVFLTYSYLSSTTEEVTNVFTVGDISASMDEMAVNEDREIIYVKEENNTSKITLFSLAQNFDYNGINSTLDDGFSVSRGDGNSYRLTYDYSYPKDPTLHINSETEANAPFTVFLKVTNNMSDYIVSKTDNINYLSIEEQLTLDSSAYIDTDTHKGYCWYDITSKLSSLDISSSSGNKTKYYCLISNPEINPTSGTRNTPEIDEKFAATMLNTSPTIGKITDIGTFKYFRTKDRNFPNVEDQPSDRSIKIKAAVVSLSEDTPTLQKALKTVPAGFWS